MGLPDELAQLLLAHRSVQDAQRTWARQLWQEGGWVFASALGKPLSLNSDYRDWKALLQAAGVPDGRLHDARRTADPRRRDVPDRIGGLLWAEQRGTDDAI